MRKKLLFVMVAGCALAALLICVCYPSDYDQVKPTKLGTVSIPAQQMTISLFCKSRPRANMIAPYEGEYRILEVAQCDQPALYYDLADTIPGETCHFEIFWYSTNRLLRFFDSGLVFDPQFRSETILDLEKHVLYAVVRNQNRVYIAKQSAAMPTLTFPRRGENSRAPGSGGISESTSSDNPKKVTEITVGKQVAYPIGDSWTQESGMLMGTIAPKG